MTKRPPGKVYKAKRWPPPWLMPTVGENVHGMVHNDGSTIWIGWLHAFPGFEGWGGKYLDGLPKNRRVVVLSVISPVLRGMLERRGFHWERHVFTAYGGDLVDGYVRERSEP